MTTIVRLFSLILLLGLTAACSSPATKALSDYERSLCRADSLVRSGTADSARVVHLLSDLHHEYDAVKELSGTKLIRLTPLPLKERLILISVCLALTVLIIWLWKLQQKISDDAMRRYYTASLSENEQNIHNNRR